MRRKQLAEDATRLGYQIDTLGEMLRHSVALIYQEDLAVCDPDRVWALIAGY